MQDFFIKIYMINKFFLSILFSIALHLVFFGSLFSFMQDTEPDFTIQINKNKTVLSVVSIENQNSKPEQKAKSSKGIEQAQSDSASGSEKASLSDEIIKIQKSISYPQMALELGLESDCIWKVNIKDGKVNGLKTLKKCKYPIFQEEFQKVIYSWKFSVQEETVLEIPVRFKIDKGVY